MNIGIMLADLLVGWSGRAILEGLQTGVDDKLN